MSAAATASTASLSSVGNDGSEASPGAVSAFASCATRLSFRDFSVLDGCGDPFVLVCEARFSERSFFLIKPISTPYSNARSSLGPLCTEQPRYSSASSASSVKRTASSRFSKL